MSVMPYQWVNIDSTTYMAITWMDWAYQNQAHTKNVLAGYGKDTDALNAIDISQGYAQQPFPSYINLLEQNISRLFAKVTWTVPDVHNNPRTWLGEGMDAPLLDYRDVNRWFDDVDWLRYSAESYGVLARVSGAFSSGHSHELQHLRFTRRD